MRHTELTRREFVQVGFSGLLGLALPGLLSARAQAKPTQDEPRAKSVVLIFLTGAPSHIDTFDLKPDAPVEIRGEFAGIDTRAAGVRISEHLPLLADHADKLAIVRSMTHNVPSHEHGTHMMLTGIDRMPTGATHMASRNDWPCYASGLEFLRPRGDGVPSGVMLPTYLNNGYGFSGQHGGVLGAKYDPWHIRRDPNDKGFEVEELRLPGGMSLDGLGQRRTLLADFEHRAAALEAAAAAGAFSDQQQKAFSLLTAGKVKRAFELDREDPKTRDRYGRHMFGQSLLLTRRLVEAGVPIVQANMGHMNNWDTHTQCFDQLKTRLLPPLDRAVSAFLEDLSARGLLDQTLVVMTGEFGRTPRVGQDSQNVEAHKSGRDHWAGVFSAVFAGAGVRGGQVIGKSDKIAAYPATRGYYPSDLGATIYQALGIHPESEVRDMLGRPLQLNRGEVMSALYTASAV